MSSKSLRHFSLPEFLGQSQTFPLNTRPFSQSKLVARSWSHRQKIVQSLGSAYNTSRSVLGFLQSGLPIVEVEDSPATSSLLSSISSFVSASVVVLSVVEALVVDLRFLVVLIVVTASVVGASVGASVDFRVVGACVGLAVVGLFVVGLLVGFLVVGSN